MDRPEVTGVMTHRNTTHLLRQELTGTSGMVDLHTELERREFFEFHGLQLEST